MRFSPAATRPEWGRRRGCMVPGLFDRGRYESVARLGWRHGGGRGRRRLRLARRRSDNRNRSYGQLGNRRWRNLGAILAPPGIPRFGAGGGGRAGFNPGRVTMAGAPRFVQMSRMGMQPAGTPNPPRLSPGPTPPRFRPASRGSGPERCRPKSRLPRLPRDHLIRSLTNCGLPGSTLQGRSFWA
jgi:hypothetical protein